MRRKEREITDENIIKSIMQEASVCRIALCKDNKPYIVPMSFGFRDNYIYLHSAQEGKKIDILKDNNDICFEVDIKDQLVKGEKPCNWTMKYYSVIGFGKSSFVEDINEKIDAMNIIMEKYSGRSDFEFPQAALNKIAIIKIELDQITGKKSQ
ncbi:pyridoxamine 5'-phosphate oxidase family protein [Clostridium oryzae]|uniref:Pyridoxamine 5'-phosphate oxidase n=1 Tax=Clostridium oryzae TaxID=1450648 RepID=A0A1V4II62_9CLOT|nr:pyridoxamine 5'-phosphate oxidase family protein [Clostridium oryzae]OPJ59698.1 pyridoxamine 5'-phosphate oxidase [Clostridium oryzae]